MIKPIQRIACGVIIFTSGINAGTVGVFVDGDE